MPMQHRLDEYCTAEEKPKVRVEFTENMLRLFFAKRCILVNCKTGAIFQDGVGVHTEKPFKNGFSKKQNIGRAFNRILFIRGFKETALAVDADKNGVFFFHLFNARDYRAYRGNSIWKACLETGKHLAKFFDTDMNKPVKEWVFE